DQPAGHLPLERVLGCEETRVRSAKTHRNAEALRGADGHIRAEFTWRTQEREREQVGRHDRERSHCMRRGEEFFEIVNGARRIRILDEYAEAFGVQLGLPVITDDDIDAQ